MKKYEWKAWRLANAYSFAELNRLREEVEGNPTSKEKPGSLWIYTRAARRKLDAIAWAVTYKLAEKRREAETDRAR